NKIFTTESSEHSEKFTAEVAGDADYGLRMTGARQAGRSFSCGLFFLNTRQLGCVVQRARREPAFDGC
ncbi:MAG: hypothetical protein ACREKM_04970, partial [Longimicrobiales bacterium]